MKFCGTRFRTWRLKSPNDFLVHQYYLDPDAVIQKLQEQAERRGEIERLLEIHKRTVPQFVDVIREHIDSPFSQ